MSPTAVPLPPSGVTSPAPTSTGASPQSSMPLPIIPKRAPPPRRKIPTPKGSTDSVPKTSVDSKEIPTTQPSTDLAKELVVEKSPEVESTLPHEMQTPATEEFTTAEELDAATAAQSMPASHDKSYTTVASADDDQQDSRSERSFNDTTKHELPFNRGGIPKEEYEDGEAHETVATGELADIDLSERMPSPPQMSRDGHRKQSSRSSVDSAAPQRVLIRSDVVATSNVWPTSTSVGRSRASPPPKPEIRPSSLQKPQPPVPPVPKRAPSIPQASQSNVDAAPLPVDERRSLPPRRRTLPPPPIPFDEPAPSGVSPQGNPPPTTLPKLEAKPPSEMDRVRPPRPPVPVVSPSTSTTPNSVKKASVASDYETLDPSGESMLLDLRIEHFQSRNEIEIDPRPMTTEGWTETDTDPIDPAFYSPLPSPAREAFVDIPGEDDEIEEVGTMEPSVLKQPDSLSPPSPFAALPDDNRKKTLAERMARLGGIPLGIPGTIPQFVPRRSSNDHGSTQRTGREEVKAGLEAQPEEAEEIDEESPEAARARRGGIAARLAAAGGMRFGVLPTTRPIASLPVELESATVHSSFPSSNAPTYSPQKARPPIDNEEDPSSSFRGADVSDQLESFPSSRPEPSSSQSALVRHEPIRHPEAQTMHPTEALPDEIDEGEDENETEEDEVEEGLRAEQQEAHPAESRQAPLTGRPPLGRPQHSSKLSRGETSSSQTMYAFQPSAGISAYQAGSEDTPPGDGGPSFGRVDLRPRSESQSPSAEDLAVLWQRIGLQVTASARLVYERGKKAIIGDGSPGGFVDTVIDAVPSARAISMFNNYFGYPIYSQNGAKVSLKLCDIMPGDIVALTDVKLKGFKGLQSYNLHIGTSGGPLLAIVQEVDTRKNKLKVYQAALQSNSYPTIEVTSYRLDDLKSGQIQIFRVEDSSQI